jgi:hypothetical protein
LATDQKPLPSCLIAVIAIMILLRKRTGNHNTKPARTHTHTRKGKAKVLAHIRSMVAIRRAGLVRYQLVQRTKASVDTAPRGHKGFSRV